MTDVSLEQRLRSLYTAEASSTPDELRDLVLAIPLRTRSQAGAVPGRRRIAALLAAALLATLLVGGGLLVGSGSVPLPWQARLVVSPADIDPCAVIYAAFDRLRSGGSRAGSVGSERWTGRRFDHDGGTTPWGARVCAHEYDGGWTNPHLLIRPEPTSLRQAELLLESAFPGRSTAGWTQLAPGRWIAPGIDRGRVYHAVAISADPYFFVVTASGAGGWSRGVESPGAMALAQAVLAELGDPPASR